MSSSVVPFSSCLQSSPASGSFAMSVLCIKWPKYWNFSFSISPSSEYSGLNSFRIDWFDLLRPPCYSELLEGIITPLNASSTSLPCLHGCCTLQFSLIQATYSPVLQVLQSLEISCILLAAQHNFQLIISSPCTKTPLLFKFHTS